MDYAKIILRFEDALDDNYDKFISIVEEEFTGDRREKLLNLYQTEPYKTQLKTAPASAIQYFHNSFVGGYCMHVMNVIEHSKQLTNWYGKVGGTVDYELEEIVFAAMHHDLGKLGDENGPYYKLSEDDWKIKRGNFFERNGDLHHMDVGLRSFYILSKHGISYTQKELLGIRCADGLYEEGNKDILMPGFNEDLALKTNLPKILHMADFAAANKERDAYYKFIAEESEGLKKLFDQKETCL